MGPDSSLTQRCQLPTKLPDRDITRAELESFWIKDRKNLVLCGLTHDALVKFIERYNRR